MILRGRSSLLVVLELLLLLLEISSPADMAEIEETETGRGRGGRARRTRGESEEREEGGRLETSMTCLVRSLLELGLLVLKFASMVMPAAIVQTVDILRIETRGERGVRRVRERGE